MCRVLGRYLIFLVFRVCCVCWEEIMTCKLSVWRPGTCLLKHRGVENVLHGGGGGGAR